ncbi:MAG: GNAT family N-acetyltransferase [Nitrososphaerota archaeon]
MEYRLKDRRVLLIRRAMPQDAQAIVDIVNEVASEEYYILWDKVEYNVELERRHIEKAGLTENALILIAEVEGKIVGVGELKRGEFKKNKHTAELGIALLREYRGLGIGSLLLNEILAWAKEKGLEKVCLSVFSSNEPAIALYKRLGFELEGIRKKQFKIHDKYVDELLMAKFLS